MKTQNQFNQNILVWSIILALFGILTLVAVNVDHMRSLPEPEDEESHVQGDIVKHQPHLQSGYSVVLSQ